MVNNFELIKPLLIFDNDDLFYHAQIIKRKKENPELGSNNLSVKHYYIKSLSQFERQFSEMQALAKYSNARACINLNRRSFEKLAFLCLKKVTDQILNKDFANVQKAFSRVAGQYSTDPHKKWILDIDQKNYSTEEFLLLTNTLSSVKANIIATLPTKNGEHWITSPFNIQAFQTLYKGALVESIHKDNPTILYIP